MQDLTISSPAFNNGDYIPAKYTSDGENISPPLDFGGIGEEAKSIVMIMDDPDAATDPDGRGKTFDHWILFNISPSTTSIAENSLPEGAIQGKNSLGQSSYIGPAPPNGTHKYYFRLFELSDNLELDEGATKEQVLKAIENCTLRQTKLIGKYQAKPNQ